MTRRLTARNHLSAHGRSQERAIEETTIGFKINNLDRVID